MSSCPAILALTDALRCSVCHDIVQKPVVLGCEHLFCADCIRSIPPDTENELMYRCPLCNAPYSLQRCRPNARLDLIATNFRRLLDTLSLTPAVISPVRQTNTPPANFITADSLISLSDSEMPILQQPPTLKDNRNKTPALTVTLEQRPPLPTAPRKRITKARRKERDSSTPFASLALIPFNEFRKGDAMMQKIETLRACDFLIQFGFSENFVEELRNAADGAPAIRLYNQFLRRFRRLQNDPVLAQNPNLHLYTADLVLRTESMATGPKTSNANLYATMLQQLLARGGAESEKLRAVLRRVATEKSQGEVLDLLA